MKKVNSKIVRQAPFKVSPTFPKISKSMNTGRVAVLAEIKSDTFAKNRITKSRFLALVRAGHPEQSRKYLSGLGHNK